MLDFAVQARAHTRGDDRRRSRRSCEQHGFSEEDIWDIGGITALFALSNRMAHLIEMRANDEFYLLGRVPPPAKK